MPFVKEPRIGIQWKATETNETHLEKGTTTTSSERRSHAAICIALVAPLLLALLLNTLKTRGEKKRNACCSVRFPFSDCDDFKAGQIDNDAPSGGISLRL